MFPADEYVLRAAVVINEVGNAVRVVTVARCVDGQAKVICKRLDCLKRTLALATYSLCKFPPQVRLD